MLRAMIEWSTWINISKSFKSNNDLEYNFVVPLIVKKNYLIQIKVCILIALLFLLWLVVIPAVITGKLLSATLPLIVITIFLIVLKITQLLEHMRAVTHVFYKYECGSDIFCLVYIQHFFWMKGKFSCQCQFWAVLEL